MNKFLQQHAKNFENGNRLKSTAQKNGATDFIDKTVQIKHWKKMGRTRKCMKYKEPESEDQLIKFSKVLEHAVKDLKLLELRRSNKKESIFCELHKH